MEHPQADAARIGELQTTFTALEERCARTLLKSLDLVTDGGSRHAEFPCRAGKGELAAGRLEGFRGIEMTYEFPSYVG